MAFSLSEDKEQVVDALIARYPTRMAACIPVLHLCQEERGWVSPDIVDYVAQRLDMSTSQVQGVVTFYTMYHQREVAPNVVWVCRTLSCDLRGGKTIQEHLEKRLGCHAGETSKDGKVTLLKAECLASCGTAPMIQLNHDFHENLTIPSVDAILDRLGVAPMAGEASEAAAGVGRRSAGSSSSGSRAGGSAAGASGSGSGSAPAFEAEAIDESAFRSGEHDALAGRTTGSFRTVDLTDSQEEE